MNNIIRKLMMSTLIFVSVSGMAMKAIHIENSAFVKERIKDKKGKWIDRLKPAKKVVPGMEVTYVISYKNISQKVADKVVITNPIPKNLSFKSTDTKALFSVNGGKDFAKLSKLTVLKNGKKVKAQHSDVTHLKWVLKQSLKPDEGGKIQFTSVLN